MFTKLASLITITVTLFWRITHSVLTIQLTGLADKSQFYYPTLSQNIVDNTSPDQTSFNTETVFLNNRTYTIGGTKNVTETNVVTIYDVYAKNYTTGAPMNISRQSHAATALSDSIIVCGGGAVNGPMLQSCEQYTLAQNKWTFITQLNDAVINSAMATLGGRAYIFGGYTTVNTATNASKAEVYMYTGTAWQQRASLNEPVSNHTAVALDTDRAMICGGCRPDCAITKSASNLCYIYSASKDNYTLAGNMIKGRYAHAMATYNGYITM
jgi:hypothetical protein